MILYSLLGLVLGLIAGILPGIGPGSIMLVTLPLFLSLDTVQASVTYLALAISCQYASSVMAIVAGVPGMESALPTAKEFPIIKKYHLEHIALNQNAICSMIGNVIGIILFLLIFPHLQDFPSLFKNSIKLSILSLAYVVLIFLSDKKLPSLILMIAGSYLTTIGYNDETFQTKNFGLEILNSGIPWIPLVLGSIIGYVLYSLKEPKSKTQHFLNPKIKTPIFVSSLRGGALGFFIGFVPGLSYILSSMVTYIVEHKILAKRPLKEKTLRSIGASEAAHSSGIMAMLMPLLLFSIPITVSEGIILNVITLHSSIDEVIRRILANEYEIVAIVFVINLLSFIFVYYSKLWVKYILKINLNIFKWVIFVFGLFSIVISNQYSLSFELSIYLVTVFIFYHIKVEPLPFIMALFLYPSLQRALFLFHQL